MHVKPEVLVKYPGLLYLLAMGASVAYALNLSFYWPIYHDDTILQYGAWRILRGDMPYRDIYEMNMPGAYLLRVLCLLVFGESDFGYRLFDLTFMLLISGGIFLLAWPGKLYAAVASLFYCAYHISWGARSMAECDMMIMPFLLVALWLYRRFLHHPSQGRGMFAFGVLTGCAVWIKPISVLMPVLCFLVALVRFRMMVVRPALKAAAGFLIPAALANLWLWEGGAFYDFYSILTHFAPLYKVMKPMPWTVETMVSLGFNVYVLGMMLWLLRFRSTLDGPGRMTITLGLVYGLLHFYLQGKGFWYHLEPQRVFLCLFLAMVVPALTLKPLEMAAVQLVILSLVVHFSPLEELSEARVDDWKQTFSPSYLVQVNEDAMAALAQVPKPVHDAYEKNYPGREIQFFAFPVNEMWNVAFHYHWVPPTRHIYPFPLYLEGEYIESLRKELWGQLSQIRPLVFVIPAESWPYDDARTYDAIDNRAPWKAFFAQHYRLTVEHHGYRVYARIE